MVGNIFTYQDPNSQPKDTATTRGSRRRQTTDTQGKVEGNQRELMEGYAHLQVVYVAPANGEREAHGVGFACWHARNALAKWPLRGRGACEGRIVARGRARDTRSRVDSDTRVKYEGHSFVKADVVSNVRGPPCTWGMSYLPTAARACHIHDTRRGGRRRARRP